MKKKNGFTLVELLAVIVILAIIMIIAIPSVLGTMTVARQKTFIEFMEKVYTTTQKKIAEEQMLGKPYAADTLYIFNIKKDLGFSSTGSYYGTASYYKYKSGEEDFYITLIDDEFGMTWNFSWGIPEPDTVKNEIGLEYRIYAASDFVSMYASLGVPNFDEFTVDQVCTIYNNTSIKDWVDWNGGIYDVQGNFANCKEVPQ